MNDDASVILLRLALAAVVPAGLPSGFRFAPFGDGDVREVERLLVAARADGLAGDPRQQVGWFERVSANAEWDRELMVLVRREPDRSLAAVAHSWTSGFLKDIAVDERFRRRGLARALVSRTTRLFRARGSTHLDLKVRSENEPARRLYQGLGFRRIEA